jgi:RNA polymerase sigma-70 factor (ECF subfamily)
MNSSAGNSTNRQREQMETFVALLLPVRDRLVHFARAMTRNPDEAHDLVSDTILVALEGFVKLRSHQAFLGYLFTIATRLHRRKRRRARLFAPWVEDQAETIPDGSISPEASADAVLLYEALAQLPHQQREAVALFEISDLSLAEIRDIQGGSISAVKMRIARGRRRLATILGVPERGLPQQSDFAPGGEPDDKETDDSFLTVTRTLEQCTSQ